MKFEIRYYNRETEKFETKVIKNPNYITVFSKDEKETDEIAIIYENGLKTWKFPIIDLLYINKFE